MCKYPFPFFLQEKDQQAIQTKIRRKSTQLSLQARSVFQIPTLPGQPTLLVSHNPPSQPPSSGVSSLNTTASPHPGDTPTSLEGGQPAMPVDSAVVLNEFENFEGAGMQEMLPQYLPPPLPIVSQMQLIVTFVSAEGIIHGLEVERCKHISPINSQSHRNKLCISSMG